MNVVLLITITFTLILVHGSPKKVAHNQHPCEKKNKNNAYNKFVWKHILKETFDKSSTSEWEKYLRMKHLCKRRRQTFFMESDEENVKKICNGHGVINNEHDNLCTSDSKMLVYYLNVTSNCKILSKKEFRKYVVVACDKVENVCLPVHFEMFTNKRPNGVRPCGPQILYSSRQAHYWPEI